LKSQIKNKEEKMKITYLLAGLAALTTTYAVAENAVDSHTPIKIKEHEYSARKSGNTKVQYMSGPEAAEEHALQSQEQGEERVRKNIDEATEGKMFNSQ
jgi:hypothetical protein